ncbi:MAG: hypothetical protein L6R42_008217, partial [Xanthoria sp. 1 TBL-2021]
MMCEPREGHELVRARGWRSQGLLALCPDFWTHPAFPNGTDDCPLIAGRRGFQRFAEDEDGSALTDTQFGILIRELVQMYNPLDEGPEEGSVNGANECLELSREQSIENAGNWALYAASVKAGSCEERVVRLQLHISSISNMSSSHPAQPPPNYTLSTPLTTLLGIRHPILLAGMAHTSTAPLASAVTSAGGLGTIGGLGYSPQQLRAMIKELKSSLPSPRMPFGVDLALPSLAPTARKTNHDYTKGKLEELVDVIIEEQTRL